MLYNMPCILNVFAFVGNLSESGLTYTIVFWLSIRRLKNVHDNVKKPSGFVHMNHGGSEA